MSESCWCPLCCILDEMQSLKRPAPPPREPPSNTLEVSISEGPQSWNSCAASLSPPCGWASWSLLIVSAFFLPAAFVIPLHGDLCCDPPAPADWAACPLLAYAFTTVLDTSHGQWFLKSSRKKKEFLLCLDDLWAYRISRWKTLCCTSDHRSKRSRHLWPVCWPWVTNTSSAIIPQKPAKGTVHL